jgi:hypothetical protein
MPVSAVFAATFWRRFTRTAAAVVCAAPIAAIFARYPLPIWPLTAMLATYAVALSRWPALYLLLLPAVLPALDLGRWTGWTMIGEADLFVLATLAVLVVRDPPALTDLMPRRWQSLILLLFLASSAVGLIIGLAAPFGYTGQSSNPYLRPDNALRLAKGLAEALVLLPFLRHRCRTSANTLPLLCCGIAIGLVVVTVIVLAERALFPGILDFTTDYRVAGPFSSMHVGGGHIGAYTALALPFALALGLLSIRWLPMAAIGGIAGTYTLIVTFARTGYAAGMMACAMTGLALLPASWRRGGLSRVLAIVPGILVAAAVAFAASSTGMRSRVASAATDLLMRESNWRAGWAVRDRDLATQIFGMGLGTYQRTMLSRSRENRPSDFALEGDDTGRFVRIRMESPFYLGQKVALPRTGSVHLTLQFRGDTETAGLTWALCDKILLYSDHCQEGRFSPSAANAWKTVSAVMPVDGLGAGALGGLIQRPVELALFGTTTGTTIAIRDVGLTDSDGHPILANGDFRHGLDRWLFTDDSHVSWRIFNQYLMLLFETGVVGLVSYLAMAGMAIAGGVRAALRGDPIGGAVAGSVVSFLVSGLFDNVLEAPRIATLYFLICFAGMMLWEVSPCRPPSDRTA